MWLVGLRWAEDEDAALEAGGSMRRAWNSALRWSSWGRVLAQLEQCWWWDGEKSRSQILVDQEAEILPSMLEGTVCVFIQRKYMTCLCEKITRATVGNKLVALTISRQLTRRLWFLPVEIRYMPTFSVFFFYYYFFTFYSWWLPPWKYIYHTHAFLQFNPSIYSPF